MKRRSKEAISKVWAMCVFANSMARSIAAPRITKEARYLTFGMSSARLFFFTVNRFDIQKLFGFFRRDARGAARRAFSKHRLDWHFGCWAVVFFYAIFNGGAQIFFDDAQQCFFRKFIMVVF